MKPNVTRRNLCAVACLICFLAYSGNVVAQWPCNIAWFSCSDLGKPYCYPFGPTPYYRDMGAYTTIAVNNSFLPCNIGGQICYTWNGQIITTCNYQQQIYYVSVCCSVF